MKYKKEEWNHQALEDILTDEQIALLEWWLDVNGLDYGEYQDDMFYGVTVYSKNNENGESWSIDFVRCKEI